LELWRFYSPQIATEYVLYLIHEQLLQVILVESKDVVSKALHDADERVKLRSELERLTSELTELRLIHEETCRKLKSMQKDLDFRNQATELVSLCKLLLMGSLVPLGSLFVLYIIIDGSLFSHVHSQEI
jgi:hypothetical protein